jgi:hypothetical protein
MTTAQWRAMEVATTGAMLVFAFLIVLFAFTHHPALAATASVLGAACSVGSAISRRHLRRG